VGRLSFTARIERAPLYRARSASKKGGLATPLLEAVRCAGTKGAQAPLTPLKPLC